ncbi:uncharacterized protein SPSK_09932 [Sporothrix schenckii 1099-18]|uniref:Uncharacterized protein n=1 Tax=Sporothrix schenckii 1099-18 TaxID=1397361 RepID=A0A0F2M3C8_SPOSC|nr:uncharacterized protein SPSK_09932 [Sporothrix schenckii 1099-18]KJR84182.1 hypothetical protein SPSK_09932 [Sporothrix schenckii 1099-18]
MSGWLNAVERGKDHPRNEWNDHEYYGQENPENQLRCTRSGINLTSGFIVAKVIDDSVDAVDEVRQHKAHVGHDEDDVKCVHHVGGGGKRSFGRRGRRNTKKRGWQMQEEIQDNAKEDATMDVLAEELTQEEENLPGRPRDLIDKSEKYLALLACVIIEAYQYALLVVWK